MMVEVTQADREATDAIYEICSDEGMFATSRVTAVVATHRIQSTAALQSELAAKDAEIERLRGLLVQSRWYVQDSLEGHEHSDGRDILNAIDAELRQALGGSHV